MNNSTNRETQPLSSVSLLWPPGTAPTEADAARLAHGSADSSADLGLVALACALSLDPRYTSRIQNILATLCVDADVIRYRHEVLDDFLGCPELASGLAALLPALLELGYIGDAQRVHQTQLQLTLSRLGELEMYVDIVKQLRALLDGVGARLHSRALQQLRALLDTRADDPAFHALAAELPALGEQVRNIRSITLGVNLNPQMLPTEATLLSVNAQSFKGPSGSLLGRLLGLKGRDHSDEFQGIAPLHSTSTDNAASFGAMGIAPNPLLVPLFRDLNDVLESVSRQVARALGRYIRFNALFLTQLEGEIAFYMGATRLVQRLRAAGLPLCRPEVAPTEQRVCQVSELYNLNLALRMIDRQPINQLNANLREHVVVNEATFDDDGRIFILTGPNQGGKTTYTQAVGLAQVLCQAGLYVPGRSARISPVDGIYTHFPVEERPSLEAGRLGEEARRLSDIFAHATRHSLVLLNESLSSTSPGEGLYLARDVLRALKLLGARVIFATHLHELAEGLEHANAEWPGDCKLVSLVAQTVNESASTGADANGRRTYKIVRGPALGSSYARDIARRYGISFEQLAQALHERGEIEIPN
jgi:hypothetical protein